MNNYFLSSFLKLLFIGASLLPVVLPAQNYIPLEFTTEINTCLPQKILWNDFAIAMTDSLSSNTWPNNLSTVFGQELKTDSVFFVTYKTPLKDQTYKYIFTQINKPQTIAYSSVPGEHPFTGGAQIKIINNGSFRTFLWVGNYETPKSSVFARLYFKSYSKRFVKKLNSNIKKLEHTHCN